MYPFCTLWPRRTVNTPKISSCFCVIFSYSNNTVRRLKPKIQKRSARVYAFCAFFFYFFWHFHFILVHLIRYFYPVVSQLYTYLCMWVVTLSNDPKIIQQQPRDTLSSVVFFHPYLAFVQQTNVRRWTCV